MKLECDGCKFFNWALGCGSLEQSRSLHDFIALRHKDIALDEKLSSAPPCPGQHATCSFSYVFHSRAKRNPISIGTLLVTLININGCMLLGDEVFKIILNLHFWGSETCASWCIDQ